MPRTNTPQKNKKKKSKTRSKSSKKHKSTKKSKASSAIWTYQFKQDSNAFCDGANSRCKVTRKSTKEDTLKELKCVFCMFEWDSKDKKWECEQCESIYCPDCVRKDRDGSTTPSPSVTLSNGDAAKNKSEGSEYENMSGEESDALSESESSEHVIIDRVCNQNSKTNKKRKLQQVPNNNNSKEPLRKKRKIEKKKKAKQDAPDFFRRYRESKNKQIEQLKKQNALLIEKGNKIIAENKMLRANGKKCNEQNRRLKAKIDKLRRVCSGESGVNVNENEEKVMDCNDEINETEAHIDDEESDSKQKEKEPNADEVNREIDALLGEIDENKDTESNDDNRPLQKRKKSNDDDNDNEEEEAMKMETTPIPFPPISSNKNDKGTIIDLTGDD